MERDLLRVVDMQARARFREASEGVEGAARAAARFAGSHGKELGAGAALLGGALLAEAVRRRAQARGGVRETEVAQEAERLEIGETLVGTGAHGTKAMPARAFVMIGDAAHGAKGITPEAPGLGIGLAPDLRRELRDMDTGELLRRYKNATKDRPPPPRNQTRKRGPSLCGGRRTASATWRTPRGGTRRTRTSRPFFFALKGGRFLFFGWIFFRHP